ncbi:hypothetical protein [Meiothermus granaticius]|uniref:hypothetical protein n=1 Tax=Meiothermus granaticius TaxID=863370 RepID=UPI001F0BE7EC|nr:hypothetical protein [Meiothermus granaticius]
MALVDNALSRAKDLEESYYWRGKASAALGQTRAARADFQTALRLKPSYREAAQALQALQARASR